MKAKTYNALCKAVGKIDKEAEKYLREDAKKLESFDSDNNDTLSGIFVWAETPQDHDYWSNINKQLKDEI